MKVVLWVKYGGEISVEGPMAGTERASLEIAKLLAGKAEVVVYGRGRGTEEIGDGVLFRGVRCGSEADYIRKTLRLLPDSDILQTLSNTYFYFMEEKNAKTILNLHSDTLPLLWSGFIRRHSGKPRLTPGEEKLVNEKLTAIQRWTTGKTGGPDRVIACSKYISNYSRQILPKTPAEVIYNPVKADEKPRLEREDFILFVGALDGTKGLETLIETAGILEKKKIETPLYVIGSSRLWGLDYDEYWLKRFRGRKNIAYLGVKSREEVLEYMRTAKAGFMPSLTESLPYVSLEFQACGTPVVASNVGGIPETVVDGGTGFLTPPKDARRFAGNIIRLLEKPALRRRMGSAALRSVKRRFNPELISRRYLKAYKKVLGKG